MKTTSGVRACCGRLIVAAACTAAAAASEQALYGLKISDAGSPSLVVYALDGTPTPVGPAQPFIVGAWDVGAVDDARGVLYVSGVDANDGQRLIGLSLANGTVVSSTRFPFDEVGYIGEGIMFAWAPDLGRIVTTGEMANGTYLVGTFDPISGNFSRVTSFQRPAGLRDDIGGSAAYCAQSQRFIFDLRGAAEGAHLFSVDLASGAMIDKADPDADVIQSHLCNPINGEVYGMGIRLLPGGAWVRGVYTLDPLTLNVKIVGDTPDWGVDMGAVLAVYTASEPTTLCMYPAKHRQPPHRQRGCTLTPNPPPAPAPAQPLPLSRVHPLAIRSVPTKQRHPLAACGCLAAAQRSERYGRERRQSPSLHGRLQHGMPDNPGVGDEAVRVARLRVHKLHANFWRLFRRLL